MARRRTPRYVEPRPRAGSVLQVGRSGSGRSRARRPGASGGGQHSRPGRATAARVAAIVLVLAAAVAGGILWRSHVTAAHDRAAAARRFAAAWAAGDRTAMWRALTPGARAAHPLAGFAAAYAAADRAAGVRGVAVGRPAGEHGGRIGVPVAVATADFGT